MRIILYTGKGGVGKTSVAVSTALKCAKEGKKTLIVSLSETHSLEYSLETTLSNQPNEILKNLWAVEFDKVQELENSWAIIQEYITKLFSYQGLDSITSEELMGIPGLEKLLCFVKIASYFKQKIYDVIIIDCGTVSETLSLLTYPEMLKWWLEKLTPKESKTVKLLKPIASSMFGVKIPAYEMVMTIEKLHNQLTKMINILTDRDITSIRVILNPNKMAIKEAQRSLTYLNLYDYNIDAIIVNKALPIDSYNKYMNIILESFAPIPIYTIHLFEQEVMGIDMLSEMANIVFGTETSWEVKYKSHKQNINHIDNEYKLSINIPFKDSHQLSLNQKGQDIIIKLGAVKRIITMPESIKGFEIIGASFEGNKLEIRFRK